MRKFRLQVVIRILLAIIFALAGCYFAVYTPFWLLSAWMALFFVLMVISLVRFVEKSDRDLTNFLLAIKQNDFTNTYPQTKRNTKKLFQAFNIITSEFKRIRSEKESNHHFLQTVVEHSGVPLIAYSVHDEHITLANQAAKDLFGLPYFTVLKALRRVSVDLDEKMRKLQNNEKVLLRLEIKSEVVFVSVIMREVILQEKRHKVIAFHNINSELDQKEVESWQKLIRVLTHEIKNSVIPISTLAEVITEMIEEHVNNGRKLTELSQEDEEDLILSVQTIEKRSKGLVKFVTSYGDLAKVPKPELEEADLTDLIRTICQLEDRTLKRAGVNLRLNLPNEHVLLRLDRQMIEQVLINVIKNAVEAMDEAHTPHPQLTLDLKRTPTDVLLRIKDNGPGIDDDTLDNIFVPFFTTKKEGSGIGLSYSRQVMRAHRGNIGVRSKPGEGTEFELQFSGSSVF